MDKRYDLDRVAGVIRELGCDAVGLQEVDGRRGAQSASMQLRDLAKATGLSEISVGHTRTPPRVRKTNALLTSREVRSVRSYDLTFGGHEPRSALDVELLTEGRAVRVIVTHLGLGAGERRYQVEKLLSVLSDIPQQQPLVLLGLDRIWSRQPGSLRTFEVHRSPAARVASDHYPVKADIDVDD